MIIWLDVQLLLVSCADARLCYFLERSRVSSVTLHLSLSVLIMLGLTQFFVARALKLSEAKFYFLLSRPLIIWLDVQLLLVSCADARLCYFLERSRVSSVTLHLSLSVLIMLGLTQFFVARALKLSEAKFYFLLSRSFRGLSDSCWYCVSLVFYFLFIEECRCPEHFRSFAVPL